MKLAVALLMLCVGCSGGVDGVDWTDREREVVLDAGAEIEDVFGVRAPVESLRRVPGDFDWVGKDGDVLGTASGETGLALIYVDEIAGHGGDDLLRTTVIHELLHLMGCDGHTDGAGVNIMDAAGVYAGPLTEADVELCGGQL